MDPSFLRVRAGVFPPPNGKEGLVQGVIWGVSELVSTHGVELGEWRGGVWGGGQGGDENCTAAEESVCRVGELLEVEGLLGPAYKLIRLTPLALSL